AACHAVVHLAAIRDPGIVPDEQLFQVNVGGTFNALEAAAACGVRRFVLASSEAVLGLGSPDGGAMPDYFPLDEEHPLRSRDVRAPGPTADLLRRHFPDVPVRAPIAEFGAVISGDRARSVLGFEPRHRWREDLSPQEVEALAVEYSA